MMHGAEQMAPDPEQVLDDTVNRSEPLQMGRRLEAPHLAFALPCGLMGDFGPVVGVLLRAVHDRRRHGSAGGDALR